MPRTKATETQTDHPPAPPAAPIAEELGFFERLQQYSAEEWRSLKVYVYRCWPVIDRKEGQHFLSKLSEAFDEDYLLRTFGSGKYYLRLNSAKGTSIASTTVSVHRLDSPPKVHPDEVVASDPQNERYFKVWGYSIDSAPQQPATSQNAAEGEAVKHLGQIAEKLIERGDKEQASRKESPVNETLISLWSQTAQQRDALAEKLQGRSSDQLTVVKEVLSLMREIQPPPSSAPTTPRAKSPAETVKELAELVTAVKQLAPPAELAGATGESFWNTFAQAFAPAVAPIIGQLGQLLLVRVMAPGLGPVSAPPSQSVATVPTAPPPTPSQMNDEATIQVPDDMLSMLLPFGLTKDLLQALGRVGLKAQDAYQRGMDGCAFAQAICVLDPDGEEAYDACRQLGKSFVLQILPMLPGVKIQPGPELEQWLDDFLSYGDEDTDDESEEEPEAVSVP